MFNKGPFSSSYCNKSSTYTNRHAYCDSLALPSSSWRRIEPASSSCSTFIGSSVERNSVGQYGCSVTNSPITELVQGYLYHPFEFFSCAFSKIKRSLLNIGKVWWASDIALCAVVHIMWEQRWRCEGAVKWRSENNAIKTKYEMIKGQKHLTPYIEIYDSST